MTDDIIRIPTGGMMSLFGNFDADEVYRISLELIDDFPDHPYPVTDDDALAELLSSIAKNGQLEPAIVRDMGNGRYQLLSGHRRKLALAKLGLKEIRTVVLSNLSDNQAKAVMLDCNERRRELLPTEKGRIFFEKKKLYQSMSDDELSELRAIFGADEKYSSLSCIAKQSEESETQIKRYIRLYTKSDRSVQRLVDSGKLSLRTADELNPLSKDAQKLIADMMTQYGKSLSFEQACILRKLGNKLCKVNVLSALGVIKPVKNKSEAFKLTLSSKQLREYFPDEYSGEQITETVLRLLAEWKEANR